MSSEGYPIRNNADALPDSDKANIESARPDSSPLCEARTFPGAQYFDEIMRGKNCVGVTAPPTS